MTGERTTTRRRTHGENGVGRVHASDRPPFGKDRSNQKNRQTAKGRAERRTKKETHALRVLINTPGRETGGPTTVPPAPFSRT